ncbi:hypothetical protein A2973_00135 [Candidatus Gottesmanbacteria bacterium RIFCSPLOWO2_01_FULL_49_10]|uniref:Uncharacterized protein n=1 Tax=Candidatus Gottesmanbacteria bacterium RIFCSPLOWO2_01_FULL_49_10 TaxID=1798396 RepID=A0A1F6B162_9BACT|nr:MAG: hypothetical protein UY10_C0026G0003 [Microgenomates group bacterium GW2011_GWA2_47_8]OGG30660.1 MAG: hypothetical protein A2973_00135 [Candidatus Gottesmanbacteria bacterium RIFCSPLOWO2_01_FULL_49_10]
MLSRSVFVVGLLVFLSLVGRPAEAAKLRVRGKVSSLAPVGISYSSARLSRPTHSVLVTFTNLGTVSKASYTLSYTANGIPQGVVGTLSPSGRLSDTRDLYFGTCSKGVCTPHTNITDASLTIATTLKNGRMNTKRYIIKPKW